MNKLVLGVLSFAILMGAMVVSGKQYKTIKTQTASIEQQVQEIKYLNDNLELQIKENASLEEENFLLEEHAGVMRDSVMSVNKKLVSYRHTQKKQQRYISLVEKKLAAINAEYNGLRNKMAAIIKKGDVDNQALKNMMQKQSSLLAEIEELKNKKKWVNRVNTKPATSKASTSEVTPKGNAALEFLFANTKVDLLQIELKKKRFSKSLKKIRKGNDWRYSILNINLNHPSLDVLVNKNFKLKLMDLDQNRVVSYVESNPNFPNSKLDSKGIGFSYEGKPIELVYYNKDEKTSKNYAVQFFFIDDQGNEHIIPGAHYQIVKEGKVVY